MILDNSTRWLSQNYMIRRGLILRPFIDMLTLRYRTEWDQQNRTRTGHIRRGVKEPWILQAEAKITDHEWDVLKLMTEILSFYEEALRTLEGDGTRRRRKGGWIRSYGNIWDALPTFEWLLERLEEFKARAGELPDSRYIVVNLNAAWDKLNEYYSKLDETPVYYAAVALHPSMRWDYFEKEWEEHPDWVEKAKGMVQCLWDEEYRFLEIPSKPGSQQPKQPKLQRNSLAAHLYRKRNKGNTTDSDSPSPRRSGDTFDEYKQWYAGHPEDNIDDPIQYWINLAAQYPRLSRMALDILTVQAMSAECERLFSAAGRMVTALRNRLDAKIIELCQVLRSWHRAGLLRQLDELFTSPDEARELAKLDFMTDEEVSEWASAWLHEMDKEHEQLVAEQLDSDVEFMDGGEF